MYKTTKTHPYAASKSHFIAKDKQGLYAGDGLIRVIQMEIKKKQTWEAILYQTT